MSGDQIYQQRKQNSVLPPALTKLTSEAVSEPEPPSLDHESKHHPPATEEPEKLPQGEKGSNDKKAAPTHPSTSQPQSSGREAKEVLEPKDETSVGKEKEHPHLAEKQDKESAPLPPALSKEVEGHLPTQPPTHVEEKYQQKKLASHWSPQ